MKADKRHDKGRLPALRSGGWLDSDSLLLAHGISVSITEAFTLLLNSDATDFKGVLRHLSKWFEIDVPTALGASEIFLLKPRDFVREALAAGSAACGEVDLGIGALRIRKDFTSGVLVTHIESLSSNVKAQRRGPQKEEL